MKSRTVHCSSSRPFLASVVVNKCSSLKPTAAALVNINSSSSPSRAIDSGVFQQWAPDDHTVAFVVWHTHTHTHTHTPLPVFLCASDVPTWP